MVIKAKTVSKENISIRDFWVPSVMGNRSAAHKQAQARGGRYTKGISFPLPSRPDGWNTHYKIGIYSKGEIRGLRRDPNCGEAMKKRKLSPFMLKGGARFPKRFQRKLGGVKA